MNTIFNDSAYLSDYAGQIADAVKNNNVLQLVAPTGAGKTTMLSGRVDGKKSDMGLVDYFPNSIILVPFNVTNNLYKGLNIVSSSSNNSICWGKPNVMIWDQFNKNITEIKIIFLK